MRQKAGSLLIPLVISLQTHTPTKEERSQAEELIRSTTIFTSDSHPESSIAVALVNAAFEGDEQEVVSLIQSGANINARARGDTAATLATRLSIGELFGAGYVCGHASMETFRSFLEKDYIGVTPLMAAAAGGNTDLVRWLLASGARTEDQAFEGGTALMFATAFQRPKVVQLLLRSGADPNAKSKRGNTPLMVSTWRGALPCLLALLEDGADLNARNNEGQTALMGAARGNLVEPAQILLVAGASVDLKDNSGSTALIHAAREGNTEIMRLLLRNGADVNIQDSGGYTPLMYVSGSGRSDAAELLLESGADVHATARYGVMTAIVAAALGDHSDTVDLLRRAGASPTVDGAVIVAAARGEARLLKTLLDSGGDPNARTGWGRTALMYASERGHPEAVRLLLLRGADPNLKDGREETALTEAAFEGHADVVRQLIEFGANVNAGYAHVGNKKIGTTALMRAMIRGHRAVAVRLLEAGAELDVQDSGDETALSIAKTFRHPALVELLIEAGAK